MKTCLWCGRPYEATDKRRKYCSLSCYRARERAEPNSGTFKKGLRPWNDGMKGIHLSPASEFRPGRPCPSRCAIGAVRVRTGARDGRPRAFVKVADPNVWRLRAVVVWEKAHGPIPKGLLIHHRDRDPMNDTLDNLALLTRAAHLSEHRPAFERRRRRAASAARWGKRA